MNTNHAANKAAEKKHTFPGINSAKGLFSRHAGA